MNEPIAYCVNLDEDALIEASKILGLDPTDVNFLDTPLYTHPIRDDEDEDLFRKEQVEKFYAEARPLREKYKPRELTEEEIVDALCLNQEDLIVYIATSPHAKEKMVQRGRALLKKASEK